MRRYHLRPFRKPFLATTQGSRFPRRNSQILQVRDREMPSERNSPLVPNKRRNGRLLQPSLPNTRRIRCCLRLSPQQRYQLARGLGQMEIRASRTMPSPSSRGIARGLKRSHHPLPYLVALMVLRHECSFHVQGGLLPER